MWAVRQEDQSKEVWLPPQHPDKDLVSLSQLLGGQVEIRCGSMDSLLSLG